MFIHRKAPDDGYKWIKNQKYVSPVKKIQNMLTIQS